ncbi:FAD-binding oxidoreductase [Streptomyces sp. NPDC049585]|uniref:FAD-binding oxidoreductase n=1 Tax=Streptomyces sp. NPDC049585 TaxID=3155154 RepID=UPI003415C964
MEQDTRRALVEEDAAGAPVVAGAPPAAAGDDAVRAGAVTVTPGDARYADLIRGYNQRWVFSPESVRVVHTRRQVEDVVREAFAAGKKVAARSGGHCYEGFNTDTRILIDLSAMNAVSYDAAHRAFAIEPGATLGEVYKALYKTWGVTLPGGACPSVGIGGHVAGGGHGPLSRLHGVTVDYLHAVEVVTVDQAGEVRTITATREDFERGRSRGALWWAHTGGGGGNFGVVTRYWFRDPAAKGSDPTRLLPRPPAEVFVSTLSWPWEKVTREDFGHLVRNYSSFFERHAAADSPYASLYSQFMPTPRAAGGAISMIAQFDATQPDAERLLADFFAAVGANVSVTPKVDRLRLPWLHATAWPGLTGPNTPTFRFKAKSAYQHGCLPDDQIEAMYRHFAEVDYANPAARLLMISFGGRTNTVRRDATAFAHRNSVMEMHYVTTWVDEAGEAVHLKWLRDFYADVYKETGGVPLSNGITDGAYVNYPDTDLDDPAYNTSGTLAHRLYYGDNYEALVEAKRAFDPHNVFHHAQSLPVK